MKFVRDEDYPFVCVGAIRSQLKSPVPNAVLLRCCASVNEVSSLTAAAHLQGDVGLPVVRVPYVVALALEPEHEAQVWCALLVLCGVCTPDNTSN
jgi:hypothetical protein